MAIIAADLKIVASERMADDTSTVLGIGGGGRMGSLVIDGSAENDLFPDVMPGDRTLGVSQYRKIWLSVRSQNAEALSNASAFISARPSDANCRVLLLPAVGNDLRSDAAARADLTWFGTTVRASAPGVLTAPANSGTSVLTVDRTRENHRQTDGNYAYYRRSLLFLAGDNVVIHKADNSVRELASVLSVDENALTVTLTTNLANSYLAGALVSNLLPLSVLQAEISLPAFSQQSWLRVWSDTAATPIAPRYIDNIALENAGATTDRWACVFTSTTAFDLYSERLGRLTSGNTAANLIPVNPATNRPYFTLPASGWGSGWLPGNTVRFNTRAAAAPVWAIRTVLAGSAPGGTVNAQLTLTGDVNA